MSALATARFYLSFAILFAYCFGLLGYGFYLVFTGEPGMALLMAALVLIGGRILPKPLAWIAVVGQRAAA